MAAKEKILICEDDLEIIDILKIVIGQLGYRCEVMTRVDYGFPYEVQEVAPNLILMDLRMPDLGGEIATRLLQKEEATMDIPVVLISANSNLETIARELQVAEFLSKPFDLGQLKDVIESVLKRNQNSSTAAEE